MTKNYTRFENDMKRFKFDITDSLQTVENNVFNHLLQQYGLIELTENIEHHYSVSFKIDNTAYTVHVIDRFSIVIEGEKFKAYTSFNGFKKIVNNEVEKMRV